MRSRSRHRTGGRSTCRDGWPGTTSIGLMLASHDDHRLKLSPEQPDQDPHLEAFSASAGGMLPMGATKGHVALFEKSSSKPVLAHGADQKFTRSRLWEEQNIGLLKEREPEYRSPTSTGSVGRRREHPHVDRSFRRANPSDVPSFALELWLGNAALA